METHPVSFLHLLYRRFDSLIPLVRMNLDSDGGDVGVGANGAHVAVVGGHADVDAGARQIHGFVGYGAGRVLTIFGKARDGEHFSCSYCSRMSCRRT